MFTASEIETRTTDMGVSPAVAGLLGGMGGGITQAYATMGTCLQLERDCLVLLPKKRGVVFPEYQWTNGLTHDRNRLLYLHEDRRNHASQASREWYQPSFDMGRFCGHLPSRGHCRYQQGCQCRRT